MSRYEELEKEFPNTPVSDPEEEESYEAFLSKR